MNESNVAAYLAMIFALALFILFGVLYLVYREQRRNALRKKIMLDGDVHFVDENDKDRIIIKRTPAVSGDPSHLGDIASKTIEAIRARNRAETMGIDIRGYFHKSQKGKQHHG